MTLGFWIRTARQRAGLTQAELGAASDVHPITLSKWENDHTEPRLSKLGQVFAVLKCTNVERRAVLDAMQGFGEFPS